MQWSDTVEPETYGTVPQLFMDFQENLSFSYEGSKSKSKAIPVTGREGP
jgi:hypothetical protein